MDLLSAASRARILAIAQKDAAELLGIPFDEYLRKAVQKQRAVLDVYPRSRAAAAFNTLARKANGWPMPQNARGHLEFFVERLIHSGKTEPCLVV